VLLNKLLLQSRVFRIDNDTVYLRMQHMQVHGGLNLVCEVAQARKWNPLSDLDNVLHRDRHLRQNHLRKFWWRSVERFMGGEDQILPYPICFRRRPCNILALSCECVISSSSVLTEVKHKTVLCCELSNSITINMQITKSHLKTSNDRQRKKL